MYVESFPSKLKYARLKTGFTQREVAKEIGVAQSAIARFETGKGEPNIEVLGKLIDFYGVSADWLLGTAGGNELSDTEIKELRSAELRKRQKSIEVNRLAQKVEPPMVRLLFEFQEFLLETGRLEDTRSIDRMEEYLRVKAPQNKEPTEE